MKSKELDIAVDWVAKEAWNPGIYDADCFLFQDPKSFLLGKLNRFKPFVLALMKLYGLKSVVSSRQERIHASSTH